MKCLEKDRSRRYETANGLAADILRHLQDEPVTAGAPSAGYRLRKFVRRNRAQVQQDPEGIIMNATDSQGPLPLSIQHPWRGLLRLYQRLVRDYPFPLVSSLRLLRLDKS